MNFFKIYIKAFDLNRERYEILTSGVKYLYSYFSNVIKYGNGVLNHNIYNDALIIYGSHINHGDLSGDEHLLFYLTPESYARKFLGGSPESGAAGVTKLVGGETVFSEVLWSFVEKAENKGLALANYAFHELVHNKTYSAYKDSAENSKFVHSQSGGGVLGTYLTPEQAGSIIANSENIKAMAGVYALRIKQFRRYLAFEPGKK